MNRQHWLTQLTEAFKIIPVTAILGPRQCGKTTLAKAYAKSHTNTHLFDMEDPQDQAILEEPLTALSKLEGLIIIDEIQRQPEIFPIIRTLVDQKLKQKYLILGSASRDLIKQSSETLAGRIFHLELTPFSFIETRGLNHLWLRGGFPLSYLSDSNEDSMLWRKHYIRTFIERDIQQLGINIPANTLHRFWMMLTDYHGNLFNASEIGRAFGISHITTWKYLDILVGTFMVRELQPWFENISKRQVKSPKIYLLDTGLYQAFLDISQPEQLSHSRKLGASWEGFALEEVIRIHQAMPEECFFWATQASAELDFLLFRQGKRLGFEFKYIDAPSRTKSMLQAQRDLKLDQLTVIYPGEKTYSLGEGIEAIGLHTYLQKHK